MKRLRRDLGTHRQANPRGRDQFYAGVPDLSKYRPSVNNAFDRQTVGAGEWLEK